MSQRTPLVIIQEMLESIDAIKVYTQGLNEAAFGQQQLIQDAVIRRFEIIGEAANQLPTDWKANHHEVPWQIITDMRNRLIHGYFQVDVSVIWSTIVQNLPLLEHQLQALLMQLKTP